MKKRVLSLILAAVLVCALLPTAAMATVTEVIPCKYTGAEDFSDGLAAVRDANGKWGFFAIEGYAGTSTTPASTTAYPSTQKVDVDGKAIEFQCYALKGGNGMTNYIKLRDLADILNGSAVQFEVGWDGQVTITTGKGYTKNGSELKAISGTDGSYKWNQAPVLFDGTTKALEGIVLTDGQGGGHTFFKLRDLGDAIGFTVGWTAERGIFIETK